MPSPETIELAATVDAMTPMVPAKDFETSRRFYEELGFRAVIGTLQCNQCHGLP
jgi:hypothetical protein